MQNYVVRVPQSIFVCYKVAAPNEEAAMRLVLSGEVSEAYQELVPPPSSESPDIENFSEQTKGWSVVSL